jgi:hypothetical protein
VPYSQGLSNKYLLNIFRNPCFLESINPELVSLSLFNLNWVTVPSQTLLLPAHVFSGPLNLVSISVLSSLLRDAANIQALLCSWLFWHFLQAISSQKQSTLIDVLHYPFFCEEL